MKVRIESIGETKSFGESNFLKREFIGVDLSNTEYPQPIKFEVVKDKCSELDNFSIGQDIEVQFNIRGNRWTNPKGEEVIFNSLSVWKIEKDNGTHDITPPIEDNQGEADDLPF